MTNKEIIYLLTVCDIIYHSSSFNFQYKQGTSEYTLENNLPVFTVNYGRPYVSVVGPGKIRGTKLSINPIKPEKELWICDHAWAEKAQNYFEYLWDNKISPEENNDDKWE